jgi:hypothetical protein
MKSEIEMSNKERETAFYADLIIDAFNRNSGRKFKNYIGAVGYPGQIATLFRNNKYTLLQQGDEEVLVTICTDNNIKTYLCKVAKWLTGKDYTYDEIYKIANI